MFTHADYMNSRCTHSEFYAQFVTPTVLTQVKRLIGLEKIVACDRSDFNSIPLKYWEAIDCKSFANQAALRKAFNMKEGLFFWSKNINVCILKEAARQIRNYELKQQASNTQC